MIYEVEQKFRVAEPDGMRRDLIELGASFQRTIQQSDRYFNHPARDFRQTDEAFRVRSVGDSHYVTYKGPKLDSATKTRREIELPLGQGPDVAEQWHEILVALGFRPVAVVKKTREVGTIDWNDAKFEIARDEVENLGHFLELEVQADETELEQARSNLLTLSDHLRLTEIERRSYLSMLLTADT